MMHMVSKIWMVVANTLKSSNLSWEDINSVGFYRDFSRGQAKGSNSKINPRAWESILATTYKPRPKSPPLDLGFVDSGIKPVDVPISKLVENGSKQTRWGKDDDKLSFKLLRKQLKQYNVSLKDFFSKVSNPSSTSYF